MAESSKSRWAIAAILVSWAISVIGFIWFASGDRSNVLANVEQNADALVQQRVVVQDHESRLRTIEHQYASDIATIKHTLIAIEKQLDGSQGR
jgi:hypothetical protein